MVLMDFLYVEVWVIRVEVWVGVLVYGWGMFEKFWNILFIVVFIDFFKVYIVFGYRNLFFSLNVNDCNGFFNWIDLFKLKFEFDILI